MRQPRNMPRHEPESPSKGIVAHCHINNNDNDNDNNNNDHNDNNDNNKNDHNDNNDHNNNDHNANNDNTNNDNNNNDNNNKTTVKKSATKRQSDMSDGSSPFHFCIADYHFRFLRCRLLFDDCLFCCRCRSCRCRRCRCGCRAIFMFSSLLSLISDCVALLVVHVVWMIGYLVFVFIVADSQLFVVGYYTPPVS